MSRNNYEDEFEEDYEDELDRMRAQRRRKRADGRSKDSPPVRQQQFYDEYDDSLADDTDFDIEYLEDGPELMPTGGYRSRDIRQAQQSSSGSRPRSDYGRNQRQAPRGGQNQRNSASASGKGKKPKKKRRRGWKFFLLIVLLLAAYLYGKRWMKDRDGYWNIAVFGVDSRDSNLGKGALADVQMIASINKKTGEIRLVSIFRDTYVQINDDGDFHKINEAYFKGGYQQALDTLNRNLDIQVDDYATFNWKAVADAINILGGIDLEITDSEFYYINSFITETVESTGVYSTHLQNAGWNHLDGVQAVAYSRLRLMDTDFNRTERQRKVVSLALDKAKQADRNTLMAVIGTVLPEISTSVGLEDVIPMAKSVNRYHLGQTGGFPFAKTTALVGKLDCVIPMTLESNVVLLHQFLFDIENYQPSASVKKISAEISQRTGIYEEGKASGIDSNLTSPSGNSGGSGNSGEIPAPPPENPLPDLPPETGAEPGVEDGAGEETSPAESLEEESSSEADTAQENEGSLPQETETIVSPGEAVETTISEEQRFEGPGAVETSALEYTKPEETSAESYGPGFE